jgi:hypothetical protein
VPSGGSVGGTEPPLSATFLAQAAEQGVGETHVGFLAGLSSASVTIIGDPNTGETTAIGIKSINSYEHVFDFRSAKPLGGVLAGFQEVTDVQRSAYGDFEHRLVVDDRLNYTSYGTSQEVSGVWTANVGPEPFFSASGSFGLKRI